MYMLFVNYYQVANLSAVACTYNYDNQVENIILVTQPTSYQTMYVVYCIISHDLCYM